MQMRGTILPDSNGSGLRNRGMVSWGAGVSRCCQRGTAIVVTAFVGIASSAASSGADW